ncbi:hypothetical protein [Streptomyces sp. NBC_00212]|uniref:hypothetical protein n=1 Tax=Streptomyces sp. NBC_00212 TaxID=2975684 RepID=UPI002F909A49
MAELTLRISVAFCVERFEPLIGGEVHHAQGLVDLTARVLDAVELRVEEHQNVMILFSEQATGGIDADLR